MAGRAESVEQVWLLGRVVTVCWLGGGSVRLARRRGRSLPTRRVRTRRGTPILFTRAHWSRGPARPQTADEADVTLPFQRRTAVFVVAFLEWARVVAAHGARASLQLRAFYRRVAELRSRAVWDFVLSSVFPGLPSLCSCGQCSQPRWRSSASWLPSAAR